MTIRGVSLVIISALLTVAANLILRAVFIFHEILNTTKIIGIAIILVGIFILSGGNSL